MRRFGGMHIHVWRPIDSQFRLITARRNPNMVILVAALAVRPARRRARAGRLVDDRQPDLPRRAAGPGERAAGARASRSSPGSKRERYTADRARRVAARARSPSREQFGTDLKALIPVAGEPMVRRPVRALLASEQVGEVDRADARRRSGSPTCCPTIRASRSASIARDDRRDDARRCCDDPRPQWPLLVTTADHALLDTGDGRRILPRRGRAPTSPSAWSSATRLLQRASRRRSAPGSGSAAAPTPAPTCSRCGSPEVAPGDRAVALGRAGPQEGAGGCMSLLGPAMLLGAALRLRQPRRGAGAARRASSASTIKAVRAVATRSPAIDVDKPADHALVEAILAGRA